MERTVRYGMALAGDLHVTEGRQGIVSLQLPIGGSGAERLDTEATIYLSEEAIAAIKAL